MQVHGWGRYPIVDATVMAPVSPANCEEILCQQPAASFIPRGMGRSYGDSSLAATIISTCQLHLMLGFDANTGYVRCRAGVALADLLEVFVPRGWFLPVTPGTKFVSIGGAIASDVHGKNHHRSGCFSEYVDCFELLIGDGSIVNCSREKYAELFHATCGGMGLTGLILTVTLRLKRIQSAFIEQTIIKTHNLEETLEQFEEYDNATYSVAWIDCLATGASLGRSLLMIGEHAQDGFLHLPRKRKISIPFDMPHQLLNQYFIQTFNTLYYHRVRGKRSTQRVHYEPFFYPLDGVLHWNRLYGKNGFIQYQFVIPKAVGQEGLQDILIRIAASRRGSFLAVLKVLGKGNANFLSFPQEGYTLALDFKMANGLFELLDELDAMVCDYSGRIYLTKDARMSVETFRRGYPRWEAFQAVREQYGSKGRFASLQSRRLGLD